MSLADEMKKKAEAAGLRTTTFYVCRSCKEIIESSDYVDKCLSCGWEGEFYEASTKENAENYIKSIPNPSSDTNDAGKMFTGSTQEWNAMKEMGERMRPYIFDPARTQPHVPFTQFVFKEKMCAGIFLPRDKEVTNNKGDVIGMRQIQSPVIITNEPGFYEVNTSLNTCQGLKVLFESIPGEMDLRWSQESIHKFLYRETGKINPRELFDKIKAKYEEYLYFSKEWYVIHPLWDIGTYFCQLFPAYPYLELRGVKETAKTKVMKVSGCISYNATPIWIAPTPATLFRETHDKRPTTYLDEAENLFKMVKGKPEHDDRVEIINSGYDKSGTVPRMEKIGTKFVRMSYKTYSPKMIGSINGLQGATESRSIVHVTRRAPNNDPRGEREVDIRDPEWQAIRDELYLFMFQEYQNILKEYDTLGKATTKLKKRDWQLWRPILAIAKIIGEDLYDQTLVFALKLSEIKRGNEFTEGSWEYTLFEKMYSLLKQGQTFIKTQELVDAFSMEQHKPSSKSVASMVNRLGFEEYWKHNRDGNGYRITLEEFVSIATPLVPLLFKSEDNPSQASQASQKNTFHDDNVIEETVKDSEGLKENVKDSLQANCEGLKDGEACEAFYKHEVSKTERLRTWFERQETRPVPIDVVAKEWPEWEHLKEIGELYEPKNGFLEVL